LNDQPLCYDRELLLFGPKRNQVLELWEVQRYGADSYGDEDYVSIYGMRPADWYAKGVRVLGRTAVECTRDELGDVIGQDVAAIAAKHSTGAQIVIVDPFAGSANTLHWLLRHLPTAKGIGFESDAGVAELTQQNIAALDLSIKIMHVDYASGLARLAIAPDELLIAFIAPPWGDALDSALGLDLRRTLPPITEIVDVLLHASPQNHLLCAIQIYAMTQPASLSAVREHFDWSGVKIYGLNVLGENHGILLGTRGWAPGSG